MHSQKFVGRLLLIVGGLCDFWLTVRRNRSNHTTSQQKRKRNGNHMGASNWRQQSFFLMIACRLLGFGHQRFYRINRDEQEQNAAHEKIKQKHTHTPNDWYLISGCDFKAKFLEFYEIQMLICIYLARWTSSFHFRSFSIFQSERSQEQISSILMMKIWNIFAFRQNSVNNWLFLSFFDVDKEASEQKK